MKRAGLLAGFALLLGSAARAGDAPPPNYACVFAGTTLAYRPPGASSFDGWQHDLTTTVGYGRFASRAVALELDLGPTLVHGKYSSFGLVPGVVWTFSPYAYAAARFVVPVDPEWNFVLFPGLGISRSFGRLTPIVELNLSRAVGKGKPDFGFALTGGLLVAF
jgi:hypothetical protein